MTETLGVRQPFGVLGVFLVMLGAGLVLDGDLNLSGGLVIALGVAALVAEWREGSRRG